MYSVSDLETFLAVARQGGVTRAARRMGVSAATVSHRLSKLEAALHVKLFHRDSRTLRLTDEGMIFLERIDPILVELQSIEREVGARKSALRGRLRVTLSPWILSRFILPQLSGFRDAHPELTIDFLAVDRFVPLIEEGQDCGIRVGVLQDSALVARKLSENERMLCAAPTYIARNGAPDSISALQSANWVLLPWQRQLDVIDAENHRQRLALPQGVTVSNSDILTESAVQGLGIAIKSRLAVSREVADGRLVEVMPGVLSEPYAPIWFVYPQVGRNSRKTIEFGALATRAFHAESQTGDSA